MLEAFLLAFGRTLPVVAMHPVFGGRAVPRSVLVGVAAALSVAVLGASGTTTRPAGGAFAALLLAEVAVGATSGVVGRAVFGAIEAAGRLADDLRGASVAQIFAPQLEAPASPLGQLDLSAALALFWGLGLHGTLVGALVRGGSLAALAPGAAGLAIALDVATTLARAGLGIAGPAAACSLVADVVLGLVNRSAPQANVFTLGMPVKLVAVALVTALAMPSRAEVWGGLFSHERAWLDALLAGG